MLEHAMIRLPSSAADEKEARGSDPPTSNDTECLKLLGHGKEPLQTKKTGSPTSHWEKRPASVSC